MRKKFNIVKEKNGITLLALVITVILLLILSITIISSVNTGIFDNAQTAVEQSKIAAKKEEIELAIVKSQIKKDSDVNINDIITELEKNETIKDGNSIGNKVKTEPDGYVFVIKKNEYEEWDVKYIGKEFERIEMVLPDNIIKLNSMEYISPGCTYQLNLQKSGKTVNSSEIKWSTDNEYVSIDENGLLTVSDNSTYGNAIIKAEYNGEEFEHLLVTLHKIKLGSNVSSTAYRSNSNIELFKENTFKVNESINSGIFPGESGYTLVSLWGYTTTTQNISTHVAKWSQLNLQLIDLRQVNAILEQLTANQSEVVATLRVGYQENNNKLPIKLKVTAINMDGEILKENVEISAELTDVILNNDNRKIMPGEAVYLKLDFSLPNWNEMNDEEKQEVINLMTNDLAYTLSCNIETRQAD